MRSERLLLVLPDLAEGGAERVMLALAHEFLALGNRVDLALGRAGGALEAQVSPEVMVHHLGTAHGGVGMAAAMVRGLARLYDATRPRAVLATLSGANYAATVATGVARHRPRLALREASSLANRPGMLYTALRRLLYRSMDVLIAPAAAVAQELAAELPAARRRIVVIPNPLDIAALRRAANPPVLRAAGQRIRIIAVGRLTEAKDYPTLIQAFAHAIRRVPEMELVILGEGPLRGSLERQIAASGLSGRICLPGHVPNAPAWVVSADLFVLSSRWEGSPNALLEALALGVPIVAAAGRGGAAELLAGGKYGRLVPPGDAGALAAAVLESLERPVRYEPEAVVGDRAPREIAQRYLEVLLAPQAS